MSTPDISHIGPSGGHGHTRISHVGHRARNVQLNQAIIRFVPDVLAIRIATLIGGRPAPLLAFSVRRAPAYAVAIRTIACHAYAGYALSMNVTGCCILRIGRTTLPSGTSACGTPGAPRAIILVEAAPSPGLTPKMREARTTEKGECNKQWREGDQDAMCGVHFKDIIHFSRYFVNSQRSGILMPFSCMSPSPYSLSRRPPP